MKKLLPKHIGFEFEIGSSVSRRTVINKFNKYTGWKAKAISDPSIDTKMKHEFEIVTPPVPFAEGISKLKKALKFFQIEDIKTNYSTGLHVNLSFAKSGYNHDIDAGKLQILVDDLKWLKKFDRVDNEYSCSPKIHLGEMLCGINKKKFDVEKFINKLQAEIDEDFSDLTEKYCAVNIGKLFENKPYVEYRALGGKNYQWKVNDIVRAIREFSKAMDMSLGGRYDYLVKRYIKNMAGIVDSQPAFIPH
jgi:hypothetical protein